MDEDIKQKESGSHPIDSSNGNKNEKEKNTMANEQIIIPLLKRFIHKLKTQTPSYRFAMFQEKTFSLINDKSYYLLKKDYNKNSKDVIFPILNFTFDYFIIRKNSKKYLKVYQTFSID